MTDEQSFQPIRSDAIYVSYQTRKALRYVAKASGTNNPDALADKILWEFMEQSHPKVVEYIKAQEVAETTFAAELRAMLGQKPPF